MYESLKIAKFAKDKPATCMWYQLSAKTWGQNILRSKPL